MGTGDHVLARYTDKRIEELDKELSEARAVIRYAIEVLPIDSVDFDYCHQKAIGKAFKGQ